MLFLDELILWLASRLADRELVAREGPKVAKLVESQNAVRPIPLVSFVARQRDLRDFFGTASSGAERVALSDTIRWWDDRFDRIALGDENLPYIAQERLLRPRDGEAARILDGAFARLERRPDVWDTLLDGVNTGGDHRGSDEAAFRRTYPFSPALVSTLRSVAGALQRERTALKVMQQLLVDQRDTLQVDDVVPVGDVFDYVVAGSTALTSDVERHYATARRLYRDKIRPMLYAEHGLAADTDPRTIPAGHPYRTDDRLAKTLLLSALVPDVPAMRSLDARRLAALNHGTIASPLPGGEPTIVLSKLRRWQAQIPEIRVGGDDRQPVITVQLADVDYQSIVDKAQHVDNDGAKRRLLKQLVGQSLALAGAVETLGLQDVARVWRASRRTVQLVFGNVRDRSELPADLLVHDSATWRIVVDYPFDVDGSGPADDYARLEELRSAGTPARTIAWLPRFLSRERMRDLGRLVILEYLLAGEGGRFDANADHLSATDRAQARSVLDNQRASLRERLLGVIGQSYGSAAPVLGDVDVTSADVLVCLHPSVQPQEPVGATLGAAFDNLVDQLLAATYPAHPRFQPAEPELRLGDLRVVLDHVLRAREDGVRAVIDPPERARMRRICSPLGIGEVHENVFVLDPSSTFPWRLRFATQMGREGLAGQPVTVGRLRAWLDADAVRGLDRLTGALVIAAWAAVEDRSWWRYGSPIPTPGLEQITDDMELRPQPLPDGPQWSAARDRAAALFGVTGAAHLSAANLATLGTSVRQRADALAGPAAQLVAGLQAHADRLGIDPEATAGRLATARAAASLVRDLADTRDVALVHRLVATRLPDDHVVARSLASAADLVAALGRVRWELLDAAAALAGDRAADARLVLGRLAQAARAEEFQAPLALALRAAEDEALRLLVDPVPPPPPPPPPAAEGSIVVSGHDLAPAVDRLRAYADEHRDERLRVSWQVDR